MKRFLIKLNAVRGYDPLYGVLDALRWDHIKHFVPQHYTREHLRMRANYNWFIRVLLWVGFVRIGNLRVPEQTWKDAIRWPFSAPPKWAFSSWRSFKAWNNGHWFYLLRNNREVIKWLPNTLLPMRWGFVVCGFEFGQRG